jgi:hypothetical protein
MSDVRNLIQWLEESIVIRGFYQWVCWMVLRRAIMDLDRLSCRDASLFEIAFPLFCRRERFVDVAKGLGVTESALRRIFRLARCRETARFFFTSGDHEAWCACLGLDPNALVKALRDMGGI